MKNGILTKALKVLKFLSIYYLSAKMICFAIPKFLFMQFRVLNWESYIPLVEISKSHHMWSFFGRSYHYNLFIGLTEFLIGVLIVFKKTRLIALLISIAVCLNILILNIEFDIKFAINHVLVDLIITILLLSNYHQDLYKFFIKQGGKSEYSVEGKKSKFLNWLPYVFIVILSVSYFIFAYYTKSKFTPNAEIIGAYKVNNIKINDSIITLGNGKLTKDPMMFLEYNNQFVFSIEDTLYKGSFIIKDDKINIYLNRSTRFKMKSMNGSIIDNNSIIGLLGNNSTFEMTFERIDGSKNYLNEIYK